VPGETPPPHDGLVQRAPRLGVLRQCVEHTFIDASETRALAIDPPLELGTVYEMNAVE